MINSYELDIITMNIIQYIHFYYKVRRQIIVIMKAIGIINLYHNMKILQL